MAKDSEKESTPLASPPILSSESEDLIGEKKNLKLEVSRLGENGNYYCDSTE